MFIQSEAWFIWNAKVSVTNFSIISLIQCYNSFRTLFTTKNAFQILMKMIGLVLPNQKMLFGLN